MTTSDQRPESILAPPPAAAPLGTRVAVLGADRPCTRCGYDLVGQPVVREPTYELLLVRCPECGTATALMEYPLLGRWTGRWTMLLAAAWVLALLVLLFLTSIIAAGLSEWIGESFASPAKQAARDEFSTWFEKERAAEAAAAQAAAQGQGAAATQAAAAQLAMPAGAMIWQLTPQDLDQRLARWWETQGGVTGLVAKKGGWGTLIPAWAFVLLLFTALLAAAIGAVWSVATLGVPRRRLWTIWLLVIGVAIAMIAFLFAMERTNASYQWYGNWMVEVARFAEWRVAYPARAVGFVAFMIGIAMGLRWGRALARRTALVFLPPRLRWGLAILWTAEGLKPPSALPSDGAVARPTRTPPP